MSSREVYRRWVLGVIVVGALGVSGCTAAQLAECMSYGFSYEACVVLGAGGGGGGAAPPDNDNPGVQ